MRIYWGILFLLGLYYLRLTVEYKLFPSRIPCSPLKILLVPHGFGICPPCIYVTWIRPYQGTIHPSWGGVHPSDPPLLPYPHQPTNLVQLGLLEWIRHAKFCTLQETSKSGGKMRNLLSETGNSKPCALGVCFCEECVEFVQRKNPKVQKWSCRFFSCYLNKWGENWTS